MTATQDPSTHTCAFSRCNCQLTNKGDDDHKARFCCEGCAQDSGCSCPKCNCADA